MKKLLKITLATFACLFILSACGKQQSNENKKPLQVPSLSSAFDTSGISLQKYDNIKVSSNQLKGGSSKESLMKTLGKPYHTSDTKLTNNQNAKEYTWQLGNDAKIKYIFAIVYKDKILSKGYQQNTSSKLVKKETIKDLKNGTSYNEVINKLGSPLAEQISDGVQFLTYQNDKNGNAVNLTFKNSNLSGKNFTKLNK
ncbi:DUF3862 domain-containing protein [Apilactobacillus timberlakei]|uniref:DUF3862 domain-containing protein n=1 Tax=Apilactobacillus timberlakei TaxID=2008380 RepID=A0ABY2YWV6_9LACO|nr:DUF3862 domain-containing protein [Apilactobacillus timberlakei]TPR13135.1 DUF3862 domain-containing protein [Apilactobacillus timberlakei]TPR14185.1 DUF3862 domain-containing protein [Apilactobacillus timberlakei]TPR16438.1 DUF3862 domain-containing protein [Apilactobacillus timberlakei]